MAKSAKSKTSPKAKANRSRKGPAEPRRLKPPKYRSFRLQPRIKRQSQPVAGAPKIFARSLRHLWQNWRPFILITLVYLVLMVVLVKGFTFSHNLGDIKNFLQTLFDKGAADFSTNLALFGYLLGTAGSTNTATAGLYQLIILVVVSLAMIWALRQTHAKAKITLKDSFYQSQYPLIQFLGVTAVILLQLIPLLLANAFYHNIFDNQLAVTVAEKAIWLSAFGLLILLSLYMLCSSLFALYIVTLPEMTPLKALRAARKLVRYRRWVVMRKILFLPLALLVIAAVVSIPLILYATALAEWVFFGLSIISLVVVHSYMYSLYRELL